MADKEKDMRPLHIKRSQRREIMPWKDGFQKAHEKAENAERLARNGQGEVAKIAFLEVSNMFEEILTNVVPADIQSKARFTTMVAQYALRGENFAKADEFSTKAIDLMSTSPINFEYSRALAFNIREESRQHLEVK